MCTTKATGNIYKMRLAPSSTLETSVIKPFIKSPLTFTTRQLVLLTPPSYYNKCFPTITNECRLNPRYSRESEQRGDQLPDIVNLNFPLQQPPLSRLPAFPEDTAPSAPPAQADNALPQFPGALTPLPQTAPALTNWLALSLSVMKHCAGYNKY
ncbi:hypothetical protein BX661DRAFT_181712 [Kickxella alabastrina]|uniref:uncharacterized protein n=1 Tax=Kickxella alabastrina TaxID=61397 RepID=UPI002220AAF3|nr:uncharacterized protein BX661DRAFT_181712 [Kickxella alabastrina]KAI7829280.1 hypothetical protein BX661DRAFT_181712 [Kickxella alabastrina]